MNCAIFARLCRTVTESDDLSNDLQVNLFSSGFI